MIASRLSLAVIICASATRAYAQTDYYVSPDGLDTNSCLAVTSPCATVAHVETLASAGDTIHFGAGLYRLTNLTDPAKASTAGRISAKDDQTFVGPACDPTTAACAAVIDGSVPLAGFSGPDANGNYSVAGPSTAHGAHGCFPCMAGYGGCNFPEELFWDGGLLQHAGRQLGGVINYVSVAGGSITGTGSCTASAPSSNGPVATATIAISNGVPTGALTITSYTDCGSPVPTSWVLSGGTAGASCTGSPTITTSGGTISPPALTATSWWYDYANNLIVIGGNPLGHSVETSVTLTMFAPAANQANRVTVKNLTVQKFASQNQGGGGIDPSYGSAAVTSSGADWVVEGNFVAFNHSVGIRAGFGMQVIGNVTTQNGQLGIGAGLPATLGPSNLLVSANHVTYNNTAHMSPGFGAGGIKVGNTAGAVFRGNVVDHNYGNGIHFDVNSIGPLIDGNAVTQNWDPTSKSSGIGSGTGILFEISNGGATIRNNYVQFNGTGGTFGLQSSTSEGVEAYCNVVEAMPGITNPLWAINATNRGAVAAPPYPDYCGSATTSCSQISRNNYFHHNTFIWDSGATGSVGFLQHDPAGQPMFFALNTPPDHDQYHLSPALGSSAARFTYDNDNSGSNTALAFAAFQARGADVHGAVDTIDASGFPAVAITAPADQASVAGAVPVAVAAADVSGIARVELYVDWTLYATSTTAPYGFTLDGLASGSHTLAAVAYAGSTVTACNALSVTYASTVAGDAGTVGADAIAAAPTPGGCGCRSDRADRGGAGSLAVVALALVNACRRRRAACPR